MVTLQDDNPAVYVKSTVLEQAKQGLRDPLAIKFFDFGYAVGANPNVKPLPSDRNDETELLNGVVYELLRLNQAYNIVPAMISRVGFPYWSRSEIFNDGNGGGPVVLLPFAHLDSDSVEAVLLARPLSDSTGWYTTLYTRKQIDSLASASVLDSNGLGFKVTSFVFLDHKLFGTTAQPLVDWLTDVLAGSNLSPAAQDRCGIISWCIDVLGVVFPLTDKPVLDRTIFCWTFNTPCAGSSAGSGAGNCALNENFVWVCDYMLGNLEANGVGGGGGSSNTNPGGATNGDMGTNIMNLYNNGLISEEVMNQLLTLHFAIGLSGNDLDLLLAKPQMMNVLADFLLTNSGSANPLDPVSINSVFDFALQYNLTSGQFQTLLLNRVLFGQVKALAEGLNLNQSDVGFLIAQPSLVAQITNFLQGHAGNDPAKVFAEYVIQELRTDPSIPSNTDLSQYNFFDNFDPVINYLEANTESEDEINNGIEIEYIIQAPSPSPPPAGRLLGGSPANPNGGQDAIGRTNGDINILPAHIRGYDLFPEWLLKSQMKFLFFMATNGDEDEILDEKGDEVKNAYLNKLFGNKNGTFHKYQNSTLYLMAKNSPNFKNWLKVYGEKLNQKLETTNGNIDGVNNVEIENRVALNDTKSLIPSGKWFAKS